MTLKAGALLLVDGQQQVGHIRGISPFQLEEVIMFALTTEAIRYNSVTRQAVLISPNFRQPIFRYLVGSLSEDAIELLTRALRDGEYESKDKNLDEGAMFAILSTKLKIDFMMLTSH